MTGCTMERVTDEHYTSNAAPTGDGEVVRLGEGELARRGAQVMSTMMDALDGLRERHRVR